MDTEMTDTTSADFSRRDMLKKAAVAGAVVAWAAPAVQVIGSGVAGAQTGPGSVCPGCVDVNSFTITDVDAGGNMNITANAAGTCGTCTVVGASINYSWSIGTLVNATDAGNLTNNQQFNVINPGQAASAAFTVTVTRTCRCATCQNNQVFTCTRGGTANWNAAGVFQAPLTGDTGHCSEVC